MSFAHQDQNKEQKQDEKEEQNLTNHDILRLLCSKYTNDSIYVYKSCCDGRYLVVLMKLHDTKTNEKRYVTNRKYAKFRADKLFVIAIYDTYDPHNIDIGDSSLLSINSHYSNNGKKKSLTYTIGEIVYPDSYDENINNICSNGVHYYTSPLPAIFHKKSYNDSYFKNETFLYQNWTDNGECCYSGCIVKGSREGTWYRTIFSGDKNKPNVQFYCEVYKNHQLIYIL